MKATEQHFHVVLFIMTLQGGLNLRKSQPIDRKSCKTRKLFLTLISCSVVHFSTFLSGFFKHLSSFSRQHLKEIKTICMSDESPVQLHPTNDTVSNKKMSKKKRSPGERTGDDFGILFIVSLLIAWYLCNELLH